MSPKADASLDVVCDNESDGPKHLIVMCAGEGCFDERDGLTPAVGPLPLMLLRIFSALETKEQTKQV